MGKKNTGVNEKQAAGRAKKAENAAAKAAVAQQKLDAKEAAEWQKGANTKKAARDESAAAKADEAARKRREKAELLAAEEQAASGMGKPKGGGGGANKKKNKKKDDLSMLEDALIKDADKKSKTKKRQEQLNKQKQQSKEQSTTPQDPLLANTQAMIGNDDEMVGRKSNIARMEEMGASGMDGALEALNISVPGQAKSAKALYAEFEERMLPQVKEDYPGLRLTQYKEKVWQQWKKSPENPANQQPQES